MNYSRFLTGGARDAGEKRGYVDFKHPVIQIICELQTLKDGGRTGRRREARFREISEDVSGNYRMSAGSPAAAPPPLGSQAALF